MTGSFPLAAQRPAAPDPLSRALETARDEPIVAALTPGEALAESAMLVEEAERGDISRWAVSRAIALAAQFPRSERLQRNVGILTAIGGDDQAALTCWRDMLGRFPASTRILPAYAKSLVKCHGAERARTIVMAYLPEPSTIREPATALRAARSLAALGDHDAAVALLERLIVAGDPSEKLRAELARLRDHRKPAGLAALETLLARARDRRAEHVPARPAGAIGPIVLIGGTLGGGGAERQLANTALGLQTLSEQGAIGPVSVLCRKLDARRRHDFYLPRLERAGIRVADYLRAEPWGGNRKLSRLARHAALVDMLPHRMREGTIQLTDLLRHEAPDVVQIWQDGSIFAAGLAALLANVPRILLNVRTMPPSMRSDRRKPEQHMLYRGLLAAPGVVLTANSRIAATAYEEWLGLAKGSVAIVANGVEPLSAAGDGAEEDAWAAFERRTGAGFVLGGVMRLDANKRPLEWLEIAAALAEKLPEARFVLAGAGPLRAAAEDFADRRGLADRTLFVGRSAHIGFWLERMDALALTSRHEGMPNVLIEAQLAGVPVITTPAGGAPEAVAPAAANRVLGEPVDRREAAAHLAILAARPAGQVADESAELRRWAAARFSIDTMIERTLDIFAGR